jgi:hypothetical protein
MLGDLSAEVIERMKVEGFEPAAVVETSPHNFHAWLNHGRVLGALASTRAVRLLLSGSAVIDQVLIGDISDWPAGFTNLGREQELPSRMRPFVRLTISCGAHRLEGNGLSGWGLTKRPRSMRVG